MKNTPSPDRTRPVNDPVNSPVNGPVNRPTNVRTDRDALGSPERFGYEWATYAAILPESQHQLQRWLGSTPLNSFQGKRVLDVGCGMGRNPYWFAMAGATEVIGVDIDERSLQAARRNVQRFTNVAIKHRSAYEVDTQTLGRFDRVTCIGVLHHLSDPRHALRQMWECVNHGGELILWCYAREGNERILPFIRLARGLGSRLPLPIVRIFAKILTGFAWPFFKYFPFKTSYYRQLRGLSFANIESILLDQMIPRIAHYWTRAEITALANTLNGRAHVEFVQENSWSIRIQKLSHMRN